jgi:hypothetical protein
VHAGAAGVTTTGSGYKRTSTATKQKVAQAQLHVAIAVDVSSRQSTMMVTLALTAAPAVKVRPHLMAANLCTMLLTNTTRAALASSLGSSMRVSV